jgi:RNA polymerase sigma-70 factor (ECF subfamily)
MLVATSQPFAVAAPRFFVDELDSETLELCKQGQRAALEQFVRCYERRVFALLSRALGWGLSVEDLAQDVFLRAHQALPGFDPQGEARLSTWLLTIAYRVLVDARRRNGGRYVALEEDPTAPTDNPEDCLWRRELESALVRAVAGLAPELKDAFILAEFHGLSIAEIAQVMGARQATIKTRLFRARKHLQVWLAEIWETQR